MTPDQPLHGVHVLDLGIWRPAPFAAQLLAELGAEVTKIEPPGGDPMRMFPALYRSLNERKTVVEHDLKDEAGRAAVHALATRVDMVIEGFRPGVAERLGVGYGELRELNPSIIYCSVTGYGQNGPLRTIPGHDLNYQAWTGILAARAPEMTRPGVPLGDLAGGAYAAMSMCAALAGRDPDGEGAHIDVSMADVLLSWAAPEIDGELASDEDPGAGFPGYGTFACADGTLTLGVVTEDHFWAALCTTIGLNDVADLDPTGRAAVGHELRARIVEVLSNCERDDVVARLVAAGVPVAPVLSARDAVQSHEFERRRVVRRGPRGEPRLDHPVIFER